MRIVISLLLACYCLGVSAQSGIKDSTIHFPFIGISYGFYQPGGDLADRFGGASMLSGNVLYKTDHNFIWGVSGGFIFGDKVKGGNLLAPIATSEGQVIGLDGLYADVRIFERGYHLSATFGKIFTLGKRPNPNSGLVIMGGPGFLQHKIRFEVIGNSAPQLSKEYRKGYDQLTNGIELQEFIGYVFFGNRQLINFYGGFEFIQGFTAGRRKYNYNNTNEDKERLDLMYGVRIGWILPLYKKKPAAYYLY